MQYVESMTDVLSDHLGWHRARLKFMARFTTALLKLTTTNLRELAVALKADVKEESNYRRIRRFLSDYEVDFTTLGRLLVRLLPQASPYRVVLDSTEWHFGQRPVNVLMVGIAYQMGGIAYQGVAFPVSWTVLPDGGSSSAEEHCRALRRFFAIVDPSAVRSIRAPRPLRGAGAGRRRDLRTSASSVQRSAR